MLVIVSRGTLMWLARTSALLAARALSADVASALLAATWAAASSVVPDASARTRFSSSFAFCLAASATCSRTSLTDNIISPKARLRVILTGTDCHMPVSSCRIDCACREPRE